ncbi:TetR family transcriptional regulator [Nocardia mexicana]|uniref:TetR family transcriptional regulator n=1 Tax=Nocardia mexicana TaxID=279262 RepID=A0A370GTD9_9NOCA|nr:TetR family transcriptional regulator [Nocardia mexicana]RDI46761.1 TetR family transcriptional regulator [Nocardia mexicana]
MTLREQKKAVTRSTIEATGLRLFLERGFDEVRVEDICQEVLVHRRTFFRYFASKEDVVLSPFRRDLVEAADFLPGRPAAESLSESLRALCDVIAARFDNDNDDDRQTNLARLRLIAEVESLASAYLKVLADFEHLLGGFLADRSDTDARLAAAAAVTGFRVALETWRDTAAARPLRPMIRRNLDLLTAGMV